MVSTSGSQTALSQVVHLLSLISSHGMDCPKNQLLDGDRLEQDWITCNRALESKNLVSVVGCLVADGIVIKIDESNSGLRRTELQLEIVLQQLTWSQPVVSGRTKDKLFGECPTGR